MRIPGWNFALNRCDLREYFWIRGSASFLCSCLCSCLCAGRVSGASEGERIRQERRLRACARVGQLLGSGRSGRRGSPVARQLAADETSSPAWPRRSSRLHGSCSLNAAQQAAGEWGRPCSARLVCSRPARTASNRHQALAQAGNKCRRRFSLAHTRTSESTHVALSIHLFLSCYSN